MTEQIPLHVKLHETIKIIKKRIVLILIITILSLIIPIYLFFFSPKVYKTQFTIFYPMFYEENNERITDGNTANLDKKVIIELIKNFNLTYGKKQKYKIFENSNSIQIPLFESIKAIESPSETGNSILLEMSVNNISDIEITSKKLLEYINNNHYISSYFKTKKEKYEALGLNINQRIKEMETMKELLIKSKSIINFNIFKDIIAQEERNNNVQNIIKKSNGFEIAINPTVPISPEGFGLNYFILFGFSGLFTGILLALFIEKVLYFEKQ